MITKMKHGADKAKIYLFYAVPACDIIILKMTQCVICFSLLFVWNVRKSEETKNPVILPVFVVIVRTHLNAAHA